MRKSPLVQSMNPSLKSEITRKIGTMDAPALIAMLEFLGAADEVKFYERKNIIEGVSIPAELVEDMESFQKELSVLSKVGRTFPAKMVDGRIQIDFIAENYKPQLNLDPEDIKNSIGPCDEQHSLPFDSSNEFSLFKQEVKNIVERRHDNAESQRQYQELLFNITIRK